MSGGLGGRGDLAARVEALLGCAAVAERRGPSEAPWPLGSLASLGSLGSLAAPEPADLRALYAESDGLVLADGTTVLPRGELARTTAWLIQDRSLDWPADLVVLGEREDLVIVLDLDLEGARAGGGVLEAPTDGLASFRRFTRSLLGYLERRAGLGEGDAAPEVLAAEAATRRDREALRAALAQPWYPGSDRQEAHAALVLGALSAGAGDEAAALESFERSAAARVRAAPRGAGDLERAAAWRACAAAAREVNAPALAERCAQKASRKT